MSPARPLATAGLDQPPARAGRGDPANSFNDAIREVERLGHVLDDAQGKIRSNIINGFARKLMVLSRESRLRQTLMAPGGGGAAKPPGSSQGTQTEEAEEGVLHVTAAVVRRPRDGGHADAELGEERRRSYEARMARARAANLAI